jgi:hypothetical protein
LDWLHGECFLKVPQRKQKFKSTMWFRGQFVPILFSHNRKDIFGSEDWVATGTIQRIGASIFAAIFFSGSITLIFAAVLVRAKVSESVGGFLGQTFGIMLAVPVFLTALVSLLLTFRFVRGIVRSFYK